MSVDTVTTFFALLAVVALAVVVLSAVTWVLTRLRGREPRWSADLRGAVAPVAVPLAGAVALVADLIGAHLQRGGLAVLTTHQPVDVAAGAVHELRLG